MDIIHLSTSSCCIWFLVHRPFTQATLERLIDVDGGWVFHFLCCPFHACTYGDFITVDKAMMVRTTWAVPLSLLVPGESFTKILFCKSLILWQFIWWVKQWYNEMLSKKVIISNITDVHMFTYFFTRWVKRILISSNKVQLSSLTLPFKGQVCPQCSVEHWL